MTTREIIESLKICSNNTPGCDGCSFESVKAPDCIKQLMLAAAKELEDFKAKNTCMGFVQEASDARAAELEGRFGW